VSLIKILPEYIEKFSLTLHPEISYVSSSIAGSTGSMPLSPRPSKCLKNIILPEKSGQNVFDADSTAIPGFNVMTYEILAEIDSAKANVAKAAIDGDSVDVLNTFEKYMELVNSSSQIARNSKRFEIVRFDPPFTYKLNTSVKNAIKNILMPYYAPYYDQCHFAYTNYNTLNFFTSSNVPSNSAIIYNNLDIAGLEGRPFLPSGSFSIDFYVNPRYTNEPGENYKAGTIMHMSSTFAVSLVSGSTHDGNGSANTFRILLQLSHSADIAPSNIDASIANNKRSYPTDLVFLSKESMPLSRNHWHHVCIRWGGNLINAGSGSITIDDTQTYFNVPSSSITPPKHVSAAALILGNYYNGWDDEARFFNNVDAPVEGYWPYETIPQIEESKFKFDHPLNAEIHDVKIFDKYIDSIKMKENSKSGQSSTDTDGLLFYVPPFFTPESRIAEQIITPFQTENRDTKKPFNTIFSFGVGGCLINLQNFVREFKTGYHPRLWNLTASTIDYTVLDITANSYVYHTASTRKRNLTILPNDNGLFTPDFEILNSGSLQQKTDAFRSPHGGYNLSTVDLSDMVPPIRAYKGLTSVSATDLLKAIDNKISKLEDDTTMNNIANQIAGVTPEILSSLQGATQPGQILTIYQRTRDPSSNEVSIFDISNLYYGNKIFPGSFYLTDPNVTASNGIVKMTLSDNERGSLYRADALTPHAKWSSVGSLLYNEGVAVVKSPHIPFFGKDVFEAKFKGEQNTHIMTVNIPASVGLFNSSSNPSYRILSASFDASETDPRFVYISGVYLHDDNLNVIMRSNLAQPVKKRTTDEMLIRVKQDF